MAPRFEVPVGPQAIPPTMAGHLPFVSVIMPVFRSARDLLTEALDALCRVDYPRDRYEVLVVDNDVDGRGELEHLVAAYAPSVRYVRSPQKGAHSARNYGLIQARGEYCYFVDDDIVVDPQSLRTLAHALAAEDVGGVGGKIHPIWRDRTPPNWIRLFLDSTYVVGDDYRRVLEAAGVSEGNERLNLGLLSLLDLGDDAMDVDEGWLYSCHLMVKRSAALSAGGFGPDLLGRYALGDNEMSLLRNIIQSGLRLRYEPRAVVAHVIPSRRLTMGYLAQRTFNDGACDSYIQLRTGRVRGTGAVVSALFNRAGRAVGSIAAIVATAGGREGRWRLAFTTLCTNVGAAHYYATYLISSRRRVLVHWPNYLDALAHGR